LRLSDLYKYVVEAGIKNDPRPKKDVRKTLLKNKKRYSSLKGTRKALFDKEALLNPYSDTRVLYGDRDRDVKTIMVGVDIEGAELLVADRLNQMGNPIDLVISHHPEGRAYAELYDVMNLQTDQLKNLGISPDIAEDMMGERISEVERRLHGKNCTRNVDIAKLLNLPYMCIHTAADNMVSTYLQGLIDKKRPRSIGNLADLLEGIYEYREGAKSGIGPKILIGDRKKSAGKILVDMTGGTEGSKRVFARLSQLGIGTIVMMHLSESHYKLAKKEHMNVVIAGHIPSDNIGLNLMLDVLTKKEDLCIIPCSGFVRYSRI